MRVVRRCISALMLLVLVLWASFASAQETVEALLLEDATELALKRVPGIPLSLKGAIADDYFVYDIIILTKDGDSWNTRLNGVTGEILSAEKGKPIYYHEMYFQGAIDWRQALTIAREEMMGDHGRYLPSTGITDTSQVSGFALESSWRGLCYNFSYRGLYGNDMYTYAVYLRGEEQSSSGYVVLENEAKSLIRNAINLAKKEHPGEAPVYIDNFKYIKVDEGNISVVAVYFANSDGTVRSVYVNYETGEIVTQ